MKVNIITEAGRKNGFGHLSRCLSLYDEFLNSNISPQLVINGDKSVLQFLKQKPHLIFDWIKKQDKLHTLVKDSDIIILDSYFADQKIIDKLAQLTKVILFIDDTNRLSYPKGLVLNAAINSTALSYPKNENIIYLLGIKYAVLKKEFINAKTIKVKKEIKSILITLGGFDPIRLTLPVIKEIHKKFPGYIKNITVDKDHPDLKKLINFRNKKILIHTSPKINELINIMNKTDIAISAGGQTILELIKQGIPTIAIIVADNQEPQVKGLHKISAIEYSGSWKDKKITGKIINAINRIMGFEKRKKISAMEKMIVDGKGSSRVVNLLIKKLKNLDIEKKIKIRKVNPKDSISILNISNQPDVRKSSFNSKNISIKDHKKWFNTKLRDNNLLFFVTEVNKKIAGQIRAELLNKKAVISISVSDKYRKKKIGYNMMTYMLDYIKSKKPDVTILIAEIKIENTSSINFFKSFGFKYSKKITVKGNKAVEYAYKI